MYSILTCTGIVEKIAEQVMKGMKEHWMGVGRTSFPLPAYFVTMGKFLSLCES